MDPFQKIIRENCWKFDKGYPDSQEDIELLKSLARNLVTEQEEEAEVVNSLVPGDKDGAQQDQVADVLKNSTTADIIGLFKSLELDQKQLNKLFNRVNNFKSYRPIKKDILDSGWNEIVIKKFSKQIQDLIEDLDATETERFIKYLEGNKMEFVPPEDGTGNLFTTLETTGVNDKIIDKIVSHTAQDEKKRGVGMGEVGLTLLFNNINSAGGKGDLSIDNQEFEIKGHNATLGPTPFNLVSPFNKKLGKYGVEVLGGRAGIKFNDKQYGMNQLNQLLVDVYNSTEDKEGFKAAFKDILVKDNKLGSEAVNARFDNIDFTKPESFNTEIGLMNFIRYAKDEGFKRFLAHDYGTSTGAPKKGDYIYAKGDAESMAKQLKDAGVKFEIITPNILRPRMGFGERNFKEQ